MNWKALAVLWMILNLSLTGQTQVFNSPYDIKTAFKNENAKINGGFDSRHSFISQRDVTMFGLRALLDFDHKARVGFGVYLLNSKFYRHFHHTKPNGQDTLIAARLHFQYLSVFFEPVLLSTRRWEVSLPFHLGVGDSYYDGAPEARIRSSSTVFLSELSIDAHYKIFPWIGLGAGLGYRQMLVGNKYIREDFNAPVYSFGIKLFLGYVYNYVFHPEKI